VQATAAEHSRSSCCDSPHALLHSLHTCRSIINTITTDVFSAYFVPAHSESLHSPLGQLLPPHCSHTLATDEAKLLPTHNVSIRAAMALL
jgi:hypothetical protein